MSAMPVKISFVWFLAIEICPKHGPSTKLAVFQVNARIHDIDIRSVTTRTIVNILVRFRYSLC